MWGRYRQTFRAGGARPSSSGLPATTGRDAVGASVSPSPEPAPARGGRQGSKTAAGVTGGCDQTPRSNLGGRRSTKKNFVGMTLAAVTNSRFSRLPFLPALSVAAALGLPLLLAVRGLAIASPRLPLPPPARFHPARLTAIARQRLLGPEDAPAAFQQTDPTPGTASPTLAPGSLGRGLIFRSSWTIFTRGHGRCYSQKLKPRRGHPFPFGAPSTHREGFNLATLPQNSDRIRTRPLGDSRTAVRVRPTAASWGGSNLASIPRSFLASA
jgi:hypothetical protein